MSLEKQAVIARLSPNVPQVLLEHLLDEYIEMKRQFALGRCRPQELQGGRFAEMALRVLEYLSTDSFTPIGTLLARTAVVNQIRNNGNLHPSLRQFMLNAAEMLFDVRNRRDVAHVGSDVNPNYSDAKLVCQLADWWLTEFIRVFYQCPINEAQATADRINQVSIPIVTEVDGFVRIQNTRLGMSDRALVALYHRQPEKQRDNDLMAWVQYKNSSRFKTDILTKLHQDALIHYFDGYCTLLPKGVGYVEKNIDLTLII
jgi:hypothetical protein